MPFTATAFNCTREVSEFFLYNPDEFCVCDLPRVLFSDLKSIPKNIMGLYFLIGIEDDGAAYRLHYIGKSINIKARLSSHSRKTDFLKIYNKTGSLYVAWLEIGNSSLMDILEEILIHENEPRKWKDRAIFQFLNVRGSSGYPWVFFYKNIDHLAAVTDFPWP